MTFYSNVIALCCHFQCMINAKYFIIQRLWNVPDSLATPSNTKSSGYTENTHQIFSSVPLHTVKLVLVVVPFPPLFQPTKCLLIQQQQVQNHHCWDPILTSPGKVNSLSISQMTLYSTYLILTI